MHNPQLTRRLSLIESTDKFNGSKVLCDILRVSGQVKEWQIFHHYYGNADETNPKIEKFAMARLADGQYLIAQINELRMSHMGEQEKDIVVGNLITPDKIIHTARMELFYENGKAVAASFTIPQEGSHSWKSLEVNRRIPKDQVVPQAYARVYQNTLSSVVSPCVAQARKFSNDMPNWLAEATSPVFCQQNAAIKR